MSNFTQHGEPAFPTTGVVDREFTVAYDGMSLRDYFAAQAIAGVAMRPVNAPTPEDKAMVIAVTAYAIADAMLAERAK